MNIETIVVRPKEKVPRQSVGGAKIDIKNPSMHAVKITIMVTKVHG